MNTLKKDVLNAISSLPESADIDKIMYRVYVIDKVRKGEEAVKEGNTISVENLKKEIESW